MNKVTILGCGPSAGVPVVGFQPGGNWGKCDPKNPKNRRTRASIFVEYQGLRFLVDTAPELREHLLKNNIYQLDAVLYTHAHSDHVNGIDDLRPIHFLREKQPIPIYGERQTLEQLEKQFYYLFHQGTLEIYPKILIPHIIKPTGSFLIQEVEIRSLKQTHGPWTSLGYRFGNFAYSTDFDDLEEHVIEECLQGLDLWIVDCTDYVPKPTHNHLEKTLRWIERVKPKRAILTHMNYQMDYETLRKELPAHTEPAYDGMSLSF